MSVCIQDRRQRTVGCSSLSCQNLNMCANVIPFFSFLLFSCKLYNIAFCICSVLSFNAKVYKSYIIIIIYLQVLVMMITFIIPLTVILTFKESYSVA